MAQAAENSEFVVQAFLFTIVFVTELLENNKVSCRVGSFLTALQEET